MSTSLTHIIQWRNLHPSNSMQGIYLALMVLFAGGMLLLPFVYIDVSVWTAGIVQPQTERGICRTAIAGIIDSVLVEDGQLVQKGQPMLKLSDTLATLALHQLRVEMARREEYIYDLERLTRGDISPPMDDTKESNTLLSSLYKAEFKQYQQQLAELQVIVDKAAQEQALYARLFRDSVVSATEWQSYENNYARQLAAMRVLENTRQATWQQELARYRTEWMDMRKQAQELLSQSHVYVVRAPVAGVVTEIEGRYRGMPLQANETVCVVSPEESIVGECLVTTRDIGLLRVGQPVRFRFAAFDQRQFGLLKGWITHIGNDYTVVEDQPFFKVKCAFQQTEAQLKNGFRAALKKGMEFQAGFTIARRSLWQLLSDRLEDWLGNVQYGM